MIMAAADYAEKEESSSPPLPLQYEFQARDYHSLPYSGGLRDQPISLILQMRSTYNVWAAFNARERAITSGENIVEWMRGNNELVKVINIVNEMRKEKEEKDSG